MIRDSESLFRVMHIADEAALADASIHLASCELRFQFALPSDMSKLAPLLEMAVRIISSEPPPPSSIVCFVSSTCLCLLLLSRPNHAGVHD